jgi:integrase
MLTDTKARQAKARSTPYKLADQGGLYLHVSVTGSKSWRYDYRLQGKRETLTIGKYPDVSLADARELHAEARRQVAKGASPAKSKQAEKEAADNTFKALAESWYGALALHRSESWRVHTRHYLTRDLYPAIGNKPVRSITPADILAIMRRLEEAGTACTANFVRQTASRVFQHAIRNLRADYDPAQSLRGAVVMPRSKHRAALAAKDIPAFLLAVDAYPGKLATKVAVNLILLTMVRKAELIKATWDEVDFEAREWRIPGGRTKMKAPHIVPLSTQALECFRELQTLCCGSRYVPCPTMATWAVLWALARSIRCLLAWDTAMSPSTVCGPPQAPFLTSGDSSRMSLSGNWVMWNVTVSGQPTTALNTSRSAGS